MKRRSAPRKGLEEVNGKSFFCSSVNRPLTTYTSYEYLLNHERHVIYSIDDLTGGRHSIRAHYCHVTEFHVEIELQRSVALDPCDENWVQFIYIFSLIMTFYLPANSPALLWKIIYRLITWSSRILMTGVRPREPYSFTGRCLLFLDNLKNWHSMPRQQRPGSRGVEQCPLSHLHDLNPCYSSDCHVQFQVSTFQAI